MMPLNQFKGIYIFYKEFTFPIVLFIPSKRIEPPFSASHTDVLPLNYKGFHEH